MSSREDALWIGALDGAIDRVRAAAAAVAEPDTPGLISVTTDQKETRIYRGLSLMYDQAGNEVAVEIEVVQRGGVAALSASVLVGATILHEAGASVGAADPSDSAAFLDGFVASAIAVLPHALAELRRRDEED